MAAVQKNQEEEEDSFAKRVDKAFGSLGAYGSGNRDGIATTLSVSANIHPTWRIREEHPREPRQEGLRASLIPRSGAEKEEYNEEDEVDDYEDEDDEDEDEDDEDDASLQGPSASSSASACREFRLLGSADGSDRMDTCEGDEEDPEEEGRQMRGMIGLDCTLDFEDEEDEFDKAAIGSGVAGEEGRVYMRDIIDIEARSMDSSDSPNDPLYGLSLAERDPRANHFAARARIEEDARNAIIVEGNEQDEMIVETIAEEPKMDLITCMKRESSELKVESDKSKAQREDGPVKRVRFADDVVFEDVREKESMFIRPKPSQVVPSQVPDYVKNPSKYTRYTLDWSVEDNDDTTNIQALDACFETIKANQSKELDDTEEVPKRIHFIPRRLARGTVEKTEIGDAHKQVSIVHGHKSRTCIGEFETEYETNIEFDNDEVIEPKIASSAAAPRRYRSKKEIGTTDNDLLGSF